MFLLSASRYKKYIHTIFLAQNITWAKMFESNINYPQIVSAKSYNYYIDNIIIFVVRLVDLYVCVFHQYAFLKAKNLFTGREDLWYLQWASFTERWVKFSLPHCLLHNHSPDCDSYKYTHYHHNLLQHLLWLITFPATLPLQCLVSDISTKTDFRCITISTARKKYKNSQSELQAFRLH